VLARSYLLQQNVTGPVAVIEPLGAPPSCTQSRPVGAMLPPTADPAVPLTQVLSGSPLGAVAAQAVGLLATPTLVPQVPASATAPAHAVHERESEIFFWETKRCA